MSSPRFAEDGRLITLLASHGIEWRAQQQPSPPLAELSRLATDGKAAQFRRLFRGRTSKTDVRVIDFVDTDHPALLRMWDKRQRGYRAMGYRVDSGAPSVGRFEW